jgi:hypothetical protein
VEVARARVVAEAGPGRHHVLDRCRRQRRHRRPAREEVAVIGLHRDDRRLLQHDLRQPDMVGIGALPRQGAPRQNSAVTVVPGQQLGGEPARGARSAPGVPWGPRRGRGWGRRGTRAQDARLREGGLRHACCVERRTRMCQGCVNEGSRPCRSAVRIG